MDIKAIKDQTLAGLPGHVNRYGEIDQQIKGLEPVKKELNQEIKDSMAVLDLTEFETDQFTASYSEQNRTTMNQDAILRILKEKGMTDLIMTVETPNVTLIEDRIYKGDTDLALLIKPAIETNVVEVLKVTPKGKQKGKGGAKK